LGHALQSAAWGNGHYDWPEWEAVNPPGFHYGGGGGVELMEHPEKNWATWSPNQPGFLNAYSTSAPWEDRSEIMAALMNNGDEPRISAGLLPAGSDHPEESRLDGAPAFQFVRTLRGEVLLGTGGHFPEGATCICFLASNQPQSPLKVDLQKAIGGDLIDASGNAVAFETLKGKKYFLLYFSASWCSHCRQFMPQFLEFYQNTKYHDEFEVIFVSSDQDESQMLSYLGEMPWKAVRFNSPGESFLKTNYSKGPGIPTLVLIDSDGHARF
jgi:thiol-disulfide isomerase/thioredoxin